MRLEPILQPESALVIEDAADRDAVLAALADAAGRSLAGERSADDWRTRILSALVERENQMPTTTPEGVAFPHAILPDVDRTVLLIARLKPAVKFGGQDMPAPDIVFCMVGSASKPWEHVRLLARLARVARAAGALDRLRAADTAESLYARLLDEDRSHG